MREAKLASEPEALLAVLANRAYKPHDWDTMMPGIVFFTGLGALATFVRYNVKRKRMLATA